MRAGLGIVILFILSAGPSALADVVYTNEVNSSSSAQISLAGGSWGQTFTNTGPTAKIQSVTVYLRNSLGATGNLFIRIRNISGTPPAAVLGTVFSPQMDSNTGSVGFGGEYHLRFCCECYRHNRRNFVVLRIDSNKQPKFN